MARFSPPSYDFQRQDVAQTPPVSAGELRSPQLVSNCQLMRMGDSTASPGSRPLSSPPKDNRPSKQAKRSLPDDAHHGRPAKQSKACANCRRLKVKCDVTDPQRSNEDCSRCARLSLTCLRERKQWATAAAQEDPEPLQLTITKLERALEDILERLDMPALDLYTSPAIMQPRAPPRSTRPNSEERGDDHQGRDVSPDPINSLIEATRLNGLRSQLRSVKQRRKGGMRRMDHDLISERLLGIEEADQLLALFQKHQANHLFSAGISSDATVESLRASSTVLFTAVMLVAVLLLPGREALHETIHGHFMGTVSSVMWDRFHTLDDIRGLVIAAFWQPYLSWKLSGLSIRMATELNLHHAFYTAFSDPDVNDEERHDCLEKTRLWYLLYVLDHQFSIAYGRPPCMNELRPIKDFDLFLRAEACTEADRALIAQVTNLASLGRAFEHFGLNPKRVMDGQDSSVLNHSRFTDAMLTWRESWTDSRGESSELSRNIGLQFHFSNLLLNSIVLRGRPLEKLRELPFSLRPLALNAVESAHHVLEQFLYDPRYCAEIVGMPLYLHSMIAFAVVFLLKMSLRWKIIGITISPIDRTLPLIEAIICRLQTCKAGANHMVFSMAKGFERMLKQLKKNSADTARSQASSQQQAVTASAAFSNQATPSLDGGKNAHTTAAYDSYPHYAESFGIGRDVSVNDQSPDDLTTSAASVLAWGFQDEELWSVGMGYDLLQPSGQGLASMDLPFQMPEWL